MITTTFIKATGPVASHIYIPLAYTVCCTCSCQIVPWKSKDLFIWRNNLNPNSELLTAMGTAVAKWLLLHAAAATGGTSGERDVQTPLLR